MARGAIRSHIAKSSRSGEAAGDKVGNATYLRDDMGRAGGSSDDGSRNKCYNTCVLQAVQGTESDAPSVTRTRKVHMECTNVPLHLSL